MGSSDFQLVWRSASAANTATISLHSERWQVRWAWLQPPTRMPQASDTLLPVRERSIACRYLFGTS
jgi:hypothetical protein